MQNQGIENFIPAFEFTPCIGSNILSVSHTEFDPQ